MNPSPGAFHLGLDESQEKKNMFNTSGPAFPPIPPSQSRPLPFFSPLSLRGVWSRSPERGRRRRRSTRPPRLGDSPVSVLCVSVCLSQSPSRLALSLALSLSVRGIKKIATSIMNFCSLSLLSTVPGILR